MKAWEKDLNVGDDVLLLSDGNGEFTKAIGCELDLSDKNVRVYNWVLGLILGKC